MSKDWGQLPSDILHIDDPLAAFYLDRATHTFGSRLDRERDEIINAPKMKSQQKQMKLTMLMRKWLGVEQFASVRARR